MILQLSQRWPRAAARLTISVLKPMTSTKRSNTPRRMDAFFLASRFRLPHLVAAGLPGSIPLRGNCLSWWKRKREHKSDLPCPLIVVERKEKSSYLVKRDDGEGRHAQQENDCGDFPALVMLVGSPEASDCLGNIVLPQRKFS